MLDFGKIFQVRKKGHAVDHLSARQPWLKHLPNQLTLARVAVVPALLLLYPLDFFFISVVCAVLFALASITDFFDGYLARRYDLVSSLGALLDPIADKMLVAASLVLLASAHVVPAWIAGLLLCRDIFISGLRLVAMEAKLKVEVSQLGKAKTFVEDIALFCLFINRTVFDLPLRNIGMIGIWLALGLSLFSAYQYTREFMTKSNMFAG